MNFIKEFTATLARPKPGARFIEGNKLIHDLKEAVQKTNEEWAGDRMLEILGFDGISVKMRYSSLDKINGSRTISKYLQSVSRKLAHEMGWNEEVTRVKGRIFTLTMEEEADNSIETNKVELQNVIKAVDIGEFEKPGVYELLEQILKHVKSMDEKLEGKI
ncbi:hypothetical protein [Clostridium sp.]|uniref:hypothetical protein n=1 Tax=Clostridium sp. TaxID=1506 RepID=UPI003D6D8689